MAGANDARLASQRNANFTQAIAAYRCVSARAKQLGSGNAGGVFGQHRAGFSAHGDTAFGQGMDAQPAPYGAQVRRTLGSQRGAAAQLYAYTVAACGKRQAVEIAAGPDVVGTQGRAIAGVGCSAAHSTRAVDLCPVVLQVNVAVDMLARLDAAKTQLLAPGDQRAIV